MKSDTLILILKAVCYILVGAGASLVSGLSQWANEGTWPPRIQWVLIIASATTAAASQLLSFLSGSFKDWQQSRNGIDKTVTNTTVKP